MHYGQFIIKFDSGELGDPFAFELEQAAMEWEGLVAEKKIWTQMNADERG